MIWWCLKADSVIEVLSFRPWVWFHRSAEMVCWKSGQVMPALNEVSLIEFHSKHDFQDSVTFWCTQARHFWRVPSVHRGRICFYQDRNLYNVLSTGSPWAWWQDPDCLEQGWHGGSSGWKFTSGLKICSYSIFRHWCGYMELWCGAWARYLHICNCWNGLKRGNIRPSLLKIVRACFENLSHIHCHILLETCHVTWSHSVLFVGDYQQLMNLEPGVGHTRGGKGLHWQLLGPATQVGLLSTKLTKACKSLTKS